MRISKDQAARNRQRVLDAATAQFREKGFDHVAVAALMRKAGLTHGGFYNHFGSKADLVAEACAAAFAPAIERLDRMAALPPRERRAAVAAHADRYLSKQARDEAGARCPMVAFAGDVGRQNAKTRAAYATQVGRYVESLAKALTSETSPTSAAARAAAVVRLSTLMGALSLARSVAQADPALSDEILETVRGHLAE